MKEKPSQTFYERDQLSEEEYPNSEIRRWEIYAECRSVDPELFFDSTKKAKEHAKEICKRCRVMDQCLAYALQNDENFGVWGGMTEDERKSLKRRQSTRNR